MNIKFAGMNFNRTKFSALTGLTTVTYIEDSSHPGPFTMEATQRGVRFYGYMSKEISSMDDLQAFAKTVNEIWREHERLAPNLSVDGGALQRSAHESNMKNG